MPKKKKTNNNPFKRGRISHLCCFGRWRRKQHHAKYNESTLIWYYIKRYLIKAMRRKNHRRFSHSAFFRQLSRYTAQRKLVIIKTLAKQRVIWNRENRPEKAVRKGGAYCIGNRKYGYDSTGFGKWNMKSVRQFRKNPNDKFKTFLSFCSSRIRWSGWLLHSFRFVPGLKQMHEETYFAIWCLARCRFRSGKGDNFEIAMMRNWQ